MPRWPKAADDFDAKIDAIDTKIQKHKDAIEKLNADKDDFLSRKRDFEMQALYDFMQSSGMTAREILDMVEPSVAAMSQEQSKEV